MNWAQIKASWWHRLYLVFFWGLALLCISGATLTSIADKQTQYLVPMIALACVPSLLALILYRIVLFVVIGHIQKDSEPTLGNRLIPKVAALLVVFFACFAIAFFFDNIPTPIQSKVQKEKFLVEKTVSAVRFLDDPNPPERLYQLATNGNSDAQFQIGEWFADGKGGVTNRIAAALWFGKAATNAHPQAQTYLATMYSHGDGVEQNKPEARKWYILASANGPEWVKKIAENIDRSMTKEEIAESDRRLEEFLREAIKASVKP